MAITVASELDFGVQVPEIVRAESGGAAVSEEWLQVAQLLASNPDQWARVAETSKYPQASALSHRINKGTSQAFVPGGSYEAVARKGAPNEEGEATGEVYARYVGETVDPVKQLSDNHNLAELKAMAKEHGVAQTGNKQQVATRILQVQAEAQELA